MRSILVLDLFVLFVCSFVLLLLLFFFLQSLLSVQINVVSNLDLYVFGKIFPAMVQKLPKWRPGAHVAGIQSSPPLKIMLPSLANRYL